MRRLVLVGGGHAHVEVLRRFGRSPPVGVELTLISASRHTVYSGMLPGLVAGHYGWRACHIDLALLSRFARAHFLRDIAVGLDLERQRVRCADAVEVPYDIVSLDVGSVGAALPGQPSDGGGPPSHAAISVRPVERFLVAWDGVVQQAMTRALRVVVVGGGPGGVELCLAMQYRLRERAPQHSAQFAIVTDAQAILADHNAGVRARFERVLRERGVTVLTGRRAGAMRDGRLAFDGGESIAADYVVWASGPAAPRWLRESGLNADADGFALVDDCLCSTSHPNVFAAGDIATMLHHARPKSGVYAVRQGPPLAENLRLALREHPPRTYEPQSNALQLITSGDRCAVASWGGMSAEGAWVWRWKNWIDRRFMERYLSPFAV